ncbi:peptidyl-prolyl cis-trans isomerase (rotamase) - cyclophilin family [Idiomarina sp. A28L]|uniref:peptidylprolyl isomerase n=1 Tax=Idiomarina sp. A28L TaxID=1036674 RepID=UPI0002138D76|nr:peptidylprolyl isomerase [Idiomarina sp. A28L]EGN74446.1 peptidyl-prolyl cis-trans isomerase (rotamase) - cyclophilin family [Idiomarina sp. A28L]
MKTWLLAAVFAFTSAIVPVALADDGDIQKTNLYPKVKFVTSMGEMVVELNRWKAPLTVDHFLKHVVSGSYNDTLFHRVVADFVVQGGGYERDWTPLPEGDTVVNEAGNGLANNFGTIALARVNDPHSARRQFYFNVQDNDRLNPSARRWGYAVFGQVIENAELLHELAKVETGFNDDLGFPDVPVEQLRLISVELLPEEK